MKKDTNQTDGSVDEYIAQFPLEVRQILLKLRSVIKQEAPQAKEKISYRIPAYEYNGPLVYFAAYAGHIGFYPTASGIEAFRDRLSGYKLSKGTVQFPIDRPLPYQLIGEIVRFRMGENSR